MKNLFIAIAITLSSFAFSQEQFNPNLIIDLTEQQALERYKSSNVRKALKLKLKDFDYQYFIQQAQTDKLSDIIILNSTDDKKIIRLIKLADNYQKTINDFGLPMCDDCGMIIFSSEYDIKHNFDFRGANYNSIIE